MSILLIIISLFLVWIGCRGLQVTAKIGQTYGYDVVVEFFGDDPITVRMLSTASFILTCIGGYLFYLGCTL